MVLLGLPSHDGVKDGTAVDRMRLISPGDVWVEPCPIPATIIPEARQLIADIALSEASCTHVLWIDSDMRFPCDTLLRLLEHGVDIVGANCRRRGPPHDPSAHKDGKPVQPGAGLERVDVVGFGIVLTSVKALRRTIEKQGDPLFLHEWVGRSNSGAPIYRSEDHYFCDKARAAGYNIYIDHDLSRECRHITTRELTYEAGGGF